LSAALVDVFTTSFGSGARLAMAVSGDNPTLPSSLIRNAFEALRRFDAVLGPTPDGGYYLVGFRRSAFARRSGPLETREIGRLHRIFDRHVSGESARNGTRRAMLEAGLSVAVLQPWADVDTVGDLRRLASELAQHPHAAPATAAWLVNEAPWLMSTDPFDSPAIRSAAGGNDVQQ
jgi:glycosyltransferase A (GT-A) superfamily protein (DUF2064 family)